MESNTIDGEPWTRTERSSIFWCNRDAIVGQPCVSFASCSTRQKDGRVSSLRTSYEVYAAAKRLLLPNVIHRQSRYLNNRAENSHQPTRTRERPMKRCQSPEQAQRFLSIFESINAPFRLHRHLLSATRYRQLLKQAFRLWNNTALATTLP